MPGSSECSSHQRDLQIAMSQPRDTDGISMGDMGTSMLVSFGGWFEMAHWVKVPVPKCGDLSSIPGTHMKVEEGIQYYKDVL